MTSEDIITLERHEGRLLLLEREVEELRSVQKDREFHVLYPFLFKNAVFEL